MKSNPLISENELDRVALCPMMVPFAEDDLYSCARQTLKWTIRKTFDGEKVPIKDIRNKYVHLWNTKWFSAPGRSKNDGVPATGSYWEGPKQGNKTARKIFELIRLHSVIQPEQPYELPLEPYTIQGGYSLIRKHGKGSAPMVLVCEAIERNHHSKPESTLPELSSLAKYLHVKNTCHELKDVGVYHLPLLHGTPWINKYIEERLALRMVTSMLRVIKIVPLVEFAIPGTHCSKCFTKPCLEVIHEKPQLYELRS